MKTEFRETANNKLRTDSFFGGRKTAKINELIKNP